MPEWITYILIPLISALIGGGLTLAGVIVTIKWEAKHKKKEEIEKVKPIVINATSPMIPKDSKIFCYTFESQGDLQKHEVFAVFKNTDNGILFFDLIKTANKEYYPIDGATVDKNTFFYISLKSIVGDTMEKCDIYCHDIYGNKYVYNGYFNFDSDKTRYSDIIIGEIKPIK